MPLSISVYFPSVAQCAGGRHRTELVGFTHLQIEWLVVFGADTPVRIDRAGIKRVVPVPRTAHDIGLQVGRRIAVNVAVFSYTASQ